MKNNITYPLPHIVMDAVKSQLTNFTWKTLTGSDLEFLDESFIANYRGYIHLSFDKKFQITGEWLFYYINNVIAVQ